MDNNDISAAKEQAKLAKKQDAERIRVEAKGQLLKYEIFTTNFAELKRIEREAKKAENERLKREKELFITKFHPKTSA